MKELTNFLSESLTPLSMILELSSKTYKSAAEKAKKNKEFERAGKFMGAFYQQAYKEEMADSLLIPKKYKGMKAKIERISRTSFDHSELQIISKYKTNELEAYGYVCLPLDSFGSFYKKTGHTSDLFINIKGFQKVYDELVNNGQDSYDAIKKIKDEYGMNFVELLCDPDNNVRDKIQDIEVLMPVQFSMHVKMDKKIERDEKEKKKFNDWWSKMTNSTYGCVNFYDPDNDVFYQISDNGYVKKYDTVESMGIDLEFTYPDDIAEHKCLIDSLSKLLKIVNPKSKFIR